MVEAIIPLIHMTQILHEEQRRRDVQAAATGVWLGPRPPLRPTPLQPVRCAYCARVGEPTGMCEGCGAPMPGARS